MAGMDTTQTRSTALPPLFVSHGSPMIALQPGAAGAWMQAQGRAWAAAGRQPRAVISVSAHTALRGRDAVLALAAPRHEAIHDFGGFDPALGRLRYDAPGAPGLADAAAAALRQAGFDAATHPAGGLDHGAWTVLRYLLPQADVPVLPLAWPVDAPPARLFALGRALAPLLQDGVLLLASGSITHNLRRVFAQGRDDDGAPATAESSAFRDWFAERGAAADWEALLDYRARAPHAALMHPSDEHLLPWYVAAGAGGGAPATRVHASHTHADLGMDAYQFGPGPLPA